MHLYGKEYVYMATYSHIYPYLQCIQTQMVCEITSQHNYSQEADVCYTKLIKL